MKLNKKGIWAWIKRGIWAWIKRGIWEFMKREIWEWIKTYIYSLKSEEPWFCSSSEGIWMFSYN